MQQDKTTRVRVTMPTVTTQDRLHVELSDFGIPDGKALSLKVWRTNKYSSAGVLYTAANDQDVATIVPVITPVGGSLQGPTLLITEGATGFVTGDYYDIELVAIDEFNVATGTAYTAA